MSKEFIINAGKKASTKLRLIETDPMRAVSEMVSAYRDYAVLREQERTKRREIEARECVDLEEIKERRMLFMEYLTRSFDERAANFVELFERVDKALDGGDNQALAVVVASITTLATSSPFKDLATIESTRDRLKDKHHGWDL